MEIGGKWINYILVFSISFFIAMGLFKHWQLPFYIGILLIVPLLYRVLP